MASTLLYRKGTNPETDPNQDVTLLVDGSTLNVILVKRRVGPDDCLETKTPFPSAEEAERALQQEIAKWTAYGFAPLAARVKPAPSKAKKPAHVPAWLATLPEPFAKQLKKLQSTAKKVGLAQRFEEISALSSPGIDLALKKAKPADLKNVVSRVGGDPDLPEGFSWPSVDDAPIRFVGQLVIADFKALDLEGWLPKDGVLSFFAQLDSERPDYGDRCVVALFAAGLELKPVAAPTGAGKIEKVGLLTAKPRLTVPPSEGPLIDALELNDDEQAGYHDEIFLGPIPEGRHHMLLGYPNASTHHGIKGKRFLAQFDSDHHIDFEMGDYNTLRFFIDGEKVDANTLKTAVCTLSEG